MRDLYRETFDGIHASQSLRQEVLNMTKQEKTAVKRQIPRAALIAAVIVLVLAGTALAASLTGLPDWFSRQWTKETGKPIEKDQMGVITGLTDEVGLSVEKDGITVTVDSMTRGEGAVWVLLRINGLPPEADLEARMSQYQRPIEGLPEGIPAPSWREYQFMDADLIFKPEVGWNSYTYPQAVREEDGTLMYLLCYAMSIEGSATSLDAEQVTLRLGGLSWCGFLCREPIAEGPWEFTIPLQPITPVKPLSTGKCTLTCYTELETDWSLEEDGPHPTTEAVFQDIQVTPTEVRFLWADPQQAKEVQMPTRIILVMKDGTEIEVDSGGTTYIADFEGRVITTATQRVLSVPVDLRQVKALQFGFEGEDYTLELK